MAHLRKQIRDNVVTTLTGLSMIDERNYTRVQGFLSRRLMIVIIEFLPIDVFE